MERTKLSSKGQIVIPKVFRDAGVWKPGMEFSIEETLEGLLLRPVRASRGTRLDDVAGCLADRNKQPGLRGRTLAEMDAAISAEVRERRGRGRY